MSAIIHFEAYYAAEGGPGVELPTIDTKIVHDETGAPVTMSFDYDNDRWIVSRDRGDGTSVIYAEAQNPGDLADWLSEYATQLGDMHERGEL